MAPDTLALKQALDSLPEHRRGEFQVAYLGQKRSRGTALVLSFFLGHLGVDRFYLGQTGLGILKLCTLGGLFVWWFIDLFLISAAADARNLRLLRELQLLYAPAPARPALEHAR